jgi:hypothetical protein
MSFSLNVTPRRRAYVRLIGDIQRALNLALSEEHAKRGLTRKMIADLLGKNKSVVTRKFSGSGNMTLETLADLAYALDRPVKIEIPARHSTAAGSNAAPSNPQTETRPRGASNKDFVATAA